jgi:hypothetical protein
MMQLMRTGTWTIRKLAFSRQRDEHGQDWPCLGMFGTPRRPFLVSTPESTKRLRLVAPPTVRSNAQVDDLECVARFLFRGRYGTQVPQLPGFGRSRGKLNAQTYSILLALALCGESGSGLSWKAIDRSWPGWERVATDSSKRACADDILGHTLVERRPERRRACQPDEPIWTFKPGIAVATDASMREWLVCGRRPGENDSES